jgi:hypothetical protein
MVEELTRCGYAPHARPSFFIFEDFQISIIQVHRILRERRDEQPGGSLTTVSIMLRWCRG